MNNTQFRQAADLALNHPDIPLLTNNVDISIFDGFGLCNYKPIFCTIEQVACLIRWQCQYLCGGFDGEELNNIQRIGRHKFQVID